jgi:hypothetical protein
MNKQVKIAFRTTLQESEILDTIAASKGASRSEVLRRALAGEAIASLRKERAAIQAKLAEIAEARAKLGSFDEEIDRCKNALQAFANKHSDAIDSWTGVGCVGHRPEPEFGKHAELEQKLHRALFARENAKTAANSLDVREAAARKELSAVAWPAEGCCDPADTIRDHRAGCGDLRIAGATGGASSEPARRLRTREVGRQKDL